MEIEFQIRIAIRSYAIVGKENITIRRFNACRQIFSLSIHLPGLRYRGSLLIHALSLESDYC